MHHRRHGFAQAVFLKHGEKARDVLVQIVGVANEIRAAFIGQHARIGKVLFNVREILSLITTRIIGEEVSHYDSLRPLIALAHDKQDAHTVATFTRERFMSIEFLLTSLIVVLMPGTGVIYTLSHGLGGGTRAALAATLGCTLGIVPHMAASIFGLAALLHASAVAFHAVKFAGVAYLFYLAWVTLKDTSKLNVEENRARRSATHIAVQGFLINILNPKLSIFFLAFLPQFVPAASATPLFDMLVLSATFMALTALVFAGYGSAAALMRRYVISRPAVMAWFRRVFAGTFALLGLKLALTDR